MLQELRSIKCFMNKDQLAMYLIQLLTTLFLIISFDFIVSRIQFERNLENLIFKNDTITPYNLPLNNTLISDLQIIDSSLLCPEQYEQIMPYPLCEQISQSEQNEVESKHCYKSLKEIQHLILNKNNGESNEEIQLKICAQILEPSNFRSYMLHFNVSEQYNQKCVYENTSVRGYVSQNSKCSQLSENQKCSVLDKRYDSQFMISCINSHFDNQIDLFSCTEDETACTGQNTVYCVKKPFSCPIVDIYLSDTSLILNGYEEINQGANGFLYILRNDIFLNMLEGFEIRREEELFHSQNKILENIKVVFSKSQDSSNQKENKYVQLEKTHLTKNHCFHQDMEELKSYGEKRNSLELTFFSISFLITASFFLSLNKYILTDTNWDKLVDSFLVHLFIFIMFLIFIAFPIVIIANNISYAGMYCFYALTEKD